MYYQYIFYIVVTAALLVLNLYYAGKLYNTKRSFFASKYESSIIRWLMGILFCITFAMGIGYIALVLLSYIPVSIGQPFAEYLALFAFAYPLVILAIGLFLNIQRSYFKSQS